MPLWISNIKKKKKTQVWNQPLDTSKQFRSETQISVQLNMIKMKSSLAERQSLRKRMGRDGEKWLHMKFRGTSELKCQAKEEKDPKGFEKKQNKKHKGSCVPKVQGREESAVLNAAQGQKDQSIQFGN